MKNKTLGLTLIALMGTVASLCPAQSLPPLRQLGPVTSVAKEPLGSVSSVRALPDGRVLINDIVARRVLMFDSTLSTATVVADTTSATASAYGTQPGGLIAFRGDSTLFVDPASLSMLLIDPNGKVARVMSAPRANDVRFLIGGPFGNPGFDAQGRLVYRAPPNFAAFRPPQGGGGNRLPQFPTFPDTAALVRYDLATRKVDTVTFFKTPTLKMNVTQSPDGGVRVTTTTNPLPQGDDWALMSDGTIALVRTKDFHVDWLNADGTVTASPKIPFSWERLTDEGKVAFLDSAKIAIEKARASGQLGAFGVAGPQLVMRGPGGDGAAAGTRRDGAGADAQRTATAPTPAPNAQPGTMTVTAGGNTTVTAVGPGAGGAGGPLPPLVLVQPSELPDYKPAFTPGATRADNEGNLWIRTSQNVDARPVYDVVNRKGELIDRVQLPANRVLVGFGPGGVVYLAVRDGGTAHLEKARAR